MGYSTQSIVLSCILHFVKGELSNFFTLTEQLRSHWNGYNTYFGLNGGRFAPPWCPWAENSHLQLWDGGPPAAAAGSIAWYQVSRCKQLLYGQKKSAKMPSLLRSLTLFEPEWRRRFKECPICLMSLIYWPLVSENRQRVFTTVLSNIYSEAVGGALERNLRAKSENTA